MRGLIRSNRITAIAVELLVMVCISLAASVRNEFVSLGRENNRNEQLSPTVQFPAGHITSVTTSPNYPTTAGAFKQGYLGGLGDSFVTKINTTGTIVYSTFYGGVGDDWGFAIAVDGNGSAAIAGITNSPTLFLVFPAQSVFGGGGSDAYVAKFSFEGNSLIFSTYLGSGGDDSGDAITIDPAGNVFVGGATTAAFPEVDPIPGGFRGGGSDAIFARLTGTGTIIYSSLLGGAGVDIIQAMTSDRNGNVYFTGYTSSPNFHGATTAGGK
jgi:hypothetical protein